MTKEMVLVDLKTLHDISRALFNLRAITDSDPEPTELEEVVAGYLHDPASEKIESPAYRHEGRAEFRKELLHTIDFWEKDLDDEDVESHLWYQKFRDFVDRVYDYQAYIDKKVKEDLGS